MQQAAGVAHDRADRLLRVGLPGDRETHVVDRPKGLGARFERCVALNDVESQAVDQSEREPCGANNHDDDRAEGKQRSPGERQGGVECGVAQYLDEADHQERGEHRNPAASWVHPRLRKVRGGRSRAVSLQPRYRFQYVCLGKRPLATRPPSCWTAQEPLMEVAASLRSGGVTLGGRPVVAVGVGQAPPRDQTAETLGHVGEHAGRANDSLRLIAQLVRRGGDFFSGG